MTACSEQRQEPRIGDGYRGFGCEGNFAQAPGEHQQRIDARNVGVVENCLPCDLLADKQPDDSTRQHLVALNERLGAFLSVSIVDELFSSNFHSHCTHPDDSATYLPIALWSPSRQACNYNVTFAHCEFSSCSKLKHCAPQSTHNDNPSVFNRVENSRAEAAIAFRASRRMRAPARRSQPPVSSGNRS